MSQAEIKPEAENSADWNLATLCFFVRDNQVLLGLKLRGFGIGYWNGTGGKPKKGETIQETAAREALEEFVMTPEDLEHVATIYYEPYHLKVTTYISRKWAGEPTVTDEMAPRWFNNDSIPYDKMWEADTRWIPLILQGKKITARFTYDENKHVIEEYIEEWK